MRPRRSGGSRRRRRHGPRASLRRERLTSSSLIPTRKGAFDARDDDSSTRTCDGARNDRDADNTIFDKMVGTSLTDTTSATVSATTRGAIPRVASASRDTRYAGLRRPSRPNCIRNWHEAAPRNTHVSSTTSTSGIRTAWASTTTAPRSTRSTRGTSQPARRIAAGPPIRSGRSSSPSTSMTVVMPTPVLWISSRNNTLGDPSACSISVNSGIPAPSARCPAARAERLRAAEGCGGSLQQRPPLRIRLHVESSIRCATGRGSPARNDTSSSIPRARCRAGTRSAFACSCPKSAAPRPEERKSSLLVHRPTPRYLRRRSPKSRALHLGGRDARDQVENHGREVGISTLIRTPNGASASSIAFVSAAGEPTAPLSPAPRKSIGPCGGDSRCSISMSGTSAAVGRR